MNRRQAFPLLFAPLFLTGCGRPTYTYRYKLTLAVDTPDGVKEASTVVQKHIYSVSFPHSGIRLATTGQSLYLDLGPRPLVALLTRRVRGNAVEGYGGGVIREVYGGQSEWQDGRNPGLAALIKNRGARALMISQLPELVTFADPVRPDSVMAVDPNNLEASFGPGVEWHRMTIEITDEPITAGLEKKLPWLNTIGGNYLDGRISSYANGALANKLQTSAFSRQGF